MATTQTLRYDYHEFITGGVTSSWVVLGRRPECDYRRAVGVRVLAGGDHYTRGYYTMRVHWDAAELFIAIAAVMLHHGYEFRERSGGSLSCRKITGSDRTSPHAHGIAGDWNPSKNRYRHQVGPLQWGRQTDMSPEMIADIKAIRTHDGKRAVTWGGDWTNVKDPMHFNPRQRRSSTRRIDWSTVVGIEAYRVWAQAPTPIPPTPEEENMALLPIQFGDGFENPPTEAPVVGDRRFKQEDVRYIQDLAGAATDGFYGSDTALAVGTVLGRVDRGGNPMPILRVGHNEYDELLTLRYGGASDVTLTTETVEVVKNVSVN